MQQSFALLPIAYSQPRAYKMKAVLFHVIRYWFDREQGYGEISPSPCTYSAGTSSSLIMVFVSTCLQAGSAGPGFTSLQEAGIIRDRPSVSLNLWAAFYHTENPLLMDDLIAKCRVVVHSCSFMSVWPDACNGRGVASSPCPG